MNDALTVVLEDNSPLPMTVGKYNAALERAAVEAVANERNRIIENITLSIGLYGGFYPDIAEVLLNVVEGIDPDQARELKVKMKAAKK